jgi:hypothetical protein
MLYFPVTSLCNYLKWIKLNENIEALFLGSYLILGVLDFYIGSNSSLQNWLVR